MKSQEQAASPGTPVDLRVRFAETDQMGIAHHSAYVVWLEAARVEWLRVRGLSYRKLEEAGISLAVAALEVHYRRSCRFDDLVRVTVRLVEARSRRVRFAYELVRPDAGISLGHGETVHVPTDREGRAVRLPPEWLSALQAGMAGHIP